MKIKICGMTNLDDAFCAVDFGVDFIGFVFYEQSKRFVSYETVREISRKIGSNVKKVGVFVKQSDEEIKKAINFCLLDYAQVYRKVDNVDMIMAYRIKNHLPDEVEDGLILFDSYSKSIGGSGISFDLSLLGNFPHKNRLFVAGGVSVDNVEKISNLGVFGIDLVSSLEVYPGKKDVEKMREFMNIARGL